ncbi:hypothetical protein RCH12_002722 [Cryobacterium sp. MP_3.1]|uniref:hypothetical protein n=1 Tax=Cryobacterium sp. MP_3.1 TaxID=3071711 RepID=UPI002E010737|nr:hypothetical protein [Cryobacterium sp. MP_3.1]
MSNTTTTTTTTTAFISAESISDQEAETYRFFGTIVLTVNDADAELEVEWPAGDHDEATLDQVAAAAAAKLGWVLENASADDGVDSYEGREFTRREYTATRA